jgi:hypothetical protein
MTLMPSPSLAGIGMNRAPSAPHGRWLRRSTVTYKAWNSTATSPTWSRPRGDPILLTCDGENETQRVDCDGAVWTIFNIGGGSFRRCRQGLLLQAMIRCGMPSQCGSIGGGGGLLGGGGSVLGQICTGYGSI